MTTNKKKQFRAHLIKYRLTENSSFMWFWVNPETGATLSPYFKTPDAAEAWFDDVLEVHNQTYNLIDRVKNGHFYTLRARVDIDEMLITPSTFECPFTIHLDDDIIEVQVLGTNIEDAKKRVEEYFEILEWVNDV